MMEKSFLERIQIFDENYPRIQEEIALAAEKAGRRPQDITLLAATKTVPLEVINHAIDSGLSAMGENRVQEFLEKYDGLHRERCDVQFIGQLQTNKVKYLVGKVSCIQSVGSVKLAKEISRLCLREGATMKVLVEVNIGREAAKSGFAPEKVLPAAEAALERTHVRVRGLMTIPPADAQRDANFRYFQEVQALYVDMNQKLFHNELEYLSMGMSGDYEDAIRAGATMVRVGSSLFGKRDHPQHYYAI